MALDTATKRRSMFAMGLVALVVQPIPDGTIADVDQRHFLGLSAVRAAQAGLATDYLNIISENVVEPVHIADDSSNLLIAGDLEVQGWMVSLGGRVKNSTRVTTTYQIPTSDDRIFCNTGSGAFTATLPATPTDGQEYRITNTGSNNLTLGRNGNSIKGSATDAIIPSGDTLILTWEPTEGWW